MAISKKLYIYEWIHEFASHYGFFSSLKYNIFIHNTDQDIWQSG